MPPRNTKTPFARPGDPLMTTRWFDITAGTTWLIYAVWGITSIFNEIPAFDQVGAPLWYQIVWQSLIILSCLFAVVGCFGIFFDTPRWAPVRKKRMERDALWLLLTMLFVYEAVVVILLTGGDGARLSQFMLGLSLFTLPIFRIQHLTRRIRIQLAGGHR